MSWGWLFKDGRLRPVLRAAIYTPAVLCALIFLGAIAYAFIGPSALMTPTPYPAVLGFAIAVGGAIIGAAIVQRIYLDRRSVASLGFAFRRGWLWLFGLGIAFGAGMQATVFGVERLTGVSHVVGFGTAAGDVRNLAIYGAPFLLVGLYEEMFARGYLLQNLWEEWGFAPAMLITSVIFATLHLHNPNVGANLWFALAGLFAFGIWSCASVRWTKSLWLAAGVHTAWNIFEGPVFGFPVSGLLFTNTVIAQRIAGPAWLTGGPFGPEAGISSVVSLALGGIVLYICYRRGAFAQVFDPREAYERT